jgi:hypothetical protein
MEGRTQLALSEAEGSNPRSVAPRDEAQRQRMRIALRATPDEEVRGYVSRSALPQPPCVHSPLFVFCNKCPTVFDLASFPV